MELIDLKPGDCIKYNFLYSNEEEKIGLVTKIKKDNNFAFMIYLVDNKGAIDVIPFNIMEYEKI
tara:strand:+ start:1655 stop:1846 length:192 start_codon:yes stop_codon:yes gene_type:complete